MPRPILLGIVGDSASGKTTLTRGLVRILGEHQVTHISADHYHRYDRKQRVEHGLTPLHPDCNYLDILEQHLAHLRAGEPIVKPVYRHQDGTFAAAECVRPGGGAPFIIVEGLLGFHTVAMRGTYDVRVFLDPPEDLRRKWKVQRDCSRRGYTTDQVLDELDRREADAEAFIRPQRRHADMVISFMPGDRGDPEHLDARIVMRPGIVHPELAPVIDGGRDGISLVARGAESSLWVPGTISPERSAAIEEAVWDRMHFASHLRTERLGEFTIGTELHRSEPLAITQLLVLYHLVTARAAIALGAEHARADLAPSRSL
ncbi:MAG TPA: phosphoribulokinase [Solirubrobacteraceae bacterium]|jgi:phosphoribulokinase|nr:phosphoribulokinase [Solirubrobacteraceae bacterium]